MERWKYTYSGPFFVSPSNFNNAVIIAKLSDLFYSFVFRPEMRLAIAEVSLKYYKLLRGVILKVVFDC